MPILEARSLTKVIDTGTHRVEILRGVDLSVPAGQFVAIMGASGSGKSTLLDLLMLLLEPTAGRVLVDKEQINSDDLRRAWQRNIAHVPQSIYLADTEIDSIKPIVDFMLKAADVINRLAQFNKPDSI